ncbi:MAG: hypothetical protein P1P86_02120 [Bacteroidales bacterium]|nr:hypothetical protein [Bacteroidales bacterium]
MNPSPFYQFEKYSFKVITPLLALMGFTFLVHETYTGGSICLLLGGLSAFSYQGVLIDLANRRYLKYDRFLKIRIGAWKPLPPPSYVTVVRISLASRRTGPSPFVVPQDKQGARAYKVNLVVEGEQRYIGICSGSLKKMSEEALRLGNTLQIRVLDYTTPEKKWVL